MLVPKVCGLGGSLFEKVTKGHTYLIVYASKASLGLIEPSILHGMNWEYI